MLVTMLNYVEPASQCFVDDGKVSCPIGEQESMMEAIAIVDLKYIRMRGWIVVNYIGMR